MRAIERTMQFKQDFKRGMRDVIGQHWKPI